VNFTPETGVAVGTSPRSLKSFLPFGDTIVITPTRKDKAHSLPLPKGRGIPRRFDETEEGSIADFCEIYILKIGFARTIIICRWFIANDLYLSGFDVWVSLWRGCIEAA